MKKLEVKLRKEEGITLIALIITVIIMLILAGVAISAITNGEGLFGKAQIATELYNEAVQNEAEQIISLMNRIDISLNTLPPAPVQAASVVSIGDYIDYDAGEWTTEDLAKITSSAGNPTLHSTVNDSTSNNQALPTTQGQFGGFELGQRRNTNSIEYSSSYKPRTDGWRVWDKDETTGVVTLISAGHPETYYHGYPPNYSQASINILKNRNCSMYENSHAQTGSAHILTGQEAVTWYNKQYGKSYKIIENNGASSSFYQKTFSTEAPIEVLENGSYYWLASVYDARTLAFVNPSYRWVGGNYNFVYGVRFLISLKADVLLEQGTGDGSVDNPWKIVEN